MKSITKWPSIVQNLVFTATRCPYTYNTRIDRSIMYSSFSGPFEHKASMPALKELQQFQDVESADRYLCTKSAATNVRYIIIL